MIFFPWAPRLPLSRSYSVLLDILKHILRQDRWSNWNWQSIKTRIANCANSFSVFRFPVPAIPVLIMPPVWMDSQTRNTSVCVRWVSLENNAKKVEQRNGNQREIVTTHDYVLSKWSLKGQRMRRSLLNCFYAPLAGTVWNSLNKSYTVLRKS